jgi:hypothetical protein
MSLAQGAARIRTAQWGRLWVSLSETIEGLQPAGIEQLRPDAGEAAPEPGLTAQERERVAAELSHKETVPGFVGTVRVGGASHVPGVRQSEAAAAKRGRSRGGGGGGAGGAVVVSIEGGVTRCQCANGQHVSTLRDDLDRCDDACGVQGSEGLNSPTHEGCHFHGIEMDCEDSGELKYYEETGTPIIEGDFDD